LSKNAGTGSGLKSIRIYNLVYKNLNQDCTYTVCICYVGERPTQPDGKRRGRGGGEEGEEEESQGGEEEEGQGGGGQEEEEAEEQQGGAGALADCRHAPCPSGGESFRGEKQSSISLNSGVKEKS
jgi:hypothetical protein